jgi:hypothetical protein
MKEQLDPSLTAHPDLMKSIREARPILQEALGHAARLATAKWRVGDDAGRQIVILNLSDFTWPSGVETRLTPADLQDKQYLWRKFHGLLGDLLHAHLEQTVGELQAMFPEGSST